MTLQEWRSFGWLRDHETSPQEIADLLAVADRDLGDCQASGLSAQWRLNIAYNAALQAATAALSAAGFRPFGPGHHYTVIQTLAFTIEAESTLIEQLDGFRKKRNIAEYRRAGTISDDEVREVTALAGQMNSRVLAWLRERHPILLHK